jgi:hypothetical protein
MIGFGYVPCLHDDVLRSTIIAASEGGIAGVWYITYQAKERANTVYNARILVYDRLLMVFG